MSKSNYSKIAILLSLIFIISIFNGCVNNKNSSAINVDDIKNIVENYLIKNEYEVEINSPNKNKFSVQGKKGNRNIQVDFLKLRDDYSRSSIIVENTIENYTQKYVNIDYDELFELSQILGMEKITDDLIKKACEDKRDFYDSTDDDYSLPSDKVMSKIYREGFFENPVIIYELSANTKHTETVTILWNS